MRNISLYSNVDLLDYAIFVIDFLPQYISCILGWPPFPDLYNLITYKKKCFLLIYLFVFNFLNRINFIVQAKGYRVGPVYDDVLAMAWFFLELIVKSMALEKTRLFYHNLPTGIFEFPESYSCHLLRWLLLISMLFLHLYF